jgi:SAM-dependent methyltransferase
MLEIQLEAWASPEGSRQVYERIYSGESAIRLRDGFYRWILGLLDAEPGVRFLDVACGQGRLLKEAVRSGIESYGIDISRSAIETARQLVPDATLMVSDGERIPYEDHSFDRVSCIGSIEHYHSPEKGIQEIARVLKPGGRACIHLPNLFGLFWNVLWVWRTGDICVDEQPIQRYGTRVSWESLLRDNGLRVLEVRKHIRVFPSSLYDLGWYARHPKSLLYLLLTPFVPVNLCNSFVFLCTSQEQPFSVDHV